MYGSRWWLTLSSCVPMRHITTSAGHHLLNSAIQLANVLLGAITMWGPGAFLIRHMYPNKAIVWSVLPRPYNGNIILLRPYDTMLHVYYSDPNEYNIINTVPFRLQEFHWFHSRTVISSSWDLVTDNLSSSHSLCLTQWTALCHTQYHSDSLHHYMWAATDGLLTVWVVGESSDGALSQVVVQ